MTRLGVAVCALVLGASGPALGQESLAEEISDLGACATRTFERARVRGASVVLIREGRVVWSESFGTRDERTGEPVSSATVFEAASLGKVVAAYAALLLVGEKRWSLDTPARSTRLAVEAGCETPTLLHLLSHTAGLTNNLWVHRFRGACHPGARFTYAGQGYVVLEDLLETETGSPFETFIQERIFRPLGMTRSTYGKPVKEDRAAGHVDLAYGLLAWEARRDRRSVALAVTGLAAAACLWINVWTWRRHAPRRAVALTALEWVVVLGLLVAAGSRAITAIDARPGPVSLPSSLHTSADDLARFARELLRPQLTDEATRGLLLAPRVDVSPGIAWGAGIGIDRAAGATTYWQWGSNPGFQSLLVLEPRRGDAIVVLTNTGGFLDVLTGRGSGYEAAKRIARRALRTNGQWDLHRPAPNTDSRRDDPCD